MALEATERWSPESSRKGADFRWTATRGFDVTGFANEAECYDAPLVRSHLPNNGRLPVINDPHPLYPRMLCDGVGITESTPTLKRMEASYSIPVSGSIHQEEDDKLSSPMRIRWERTQITEDVDRDIVGNRLMNSAREAFKSPFARRMTQIVLVLSRFEPFYDALKAQEFENTVNNGPVTLGGYIWPDQTVLCSIIAPSQEYKVGDSVILIEYRFEMRKDRWDSRHLDAGFNVHVGDGENAALYLANGERVSGEPALLNGKGIAINTTLKAGSHLNPREQVERDGPPPGAILEEIPPSDEFTGATAYLRYQQYAAANHSELGLQ